MSRRGFVTTALAAAGVVRARRADAAQGQTARQMVERIQAAFGPTWRTTPTDDFHAGSPDVVVHGIATTVMATLDVLQRAAKARRNLVISHEPTFYTGNDDVSTLTSDPMYLAEVAFIKANDLAVFRFHDNWRSRRPEPMGRQLTEFLGLGDRRSADVPVVFVIPAATVGDVLALVDDKLKARWCRLIRYSETRVTRVGFLRRAAMRRRVPSDREGRPRFSRANKSSRKASLRARHGRERTRRRRSSRSDARSRRTRGWNCAPTR